MKKYVKNTDTKMYEENEFEVDKAIEAARKYRERKLKPTSVSLDEQTTNKLKAIAEDKGIPYQVLMRSFILEGIKRLEDDKKAS